MKYHYLMVALLVALAVLAAGCTGGGSTNATTTAPTTAPGTAAVTTAAVTTAAAGTLQTLPTGLGLAVSVNRQPYNRDIVVTFNGGAGQGSVTALSATVVRSDGSTETRSIDTRSGTDVTFKGSSGADTVSVKASLNNGQTYRFFEQTLP